VDAVAIRVDALHAVRGGKVVLPELTCAAASRTVTGLLGPSGSGKSTLIRWCDEPTVGLDPVLGRDLWQLFHALAERGVTLLVSSHVMDEAGRCDALLLLRDGRLLAEGTARRAARARTGAAQLDDVFLRLVDEATP
jgi:ABC-type multidrug transport system ATPase subunit